MPEVGGTVETSFEIRSINSDVSSGQDAARTVANTTIDAVDGVLNSLRNEGGTALQDALTSIESLGAFSPGAITFSYQIPDYLATSFALPSRFEGSVGASTVTEPQTGSFSFNLSDVSLPTISGTAPTAPTFQTVSAPSRQSAIGLPVAPTTTELTVPNAPELGAVPTLSIDAIASPQLRQLVMPLFTLPTLPAYTAVDAGELPDLPELSIGAAQFNADAYAYAGKRQYKAGEFWGVAPGKVTSINASTLVADREVTLGTTAWAARGQTLDEDTVASQRRFRTETARLAASAENRTAVNVAHTVKRGFVFNGAAEVVKQWRQDFEFDLITLSKLDYEMVQTYAAAWLDTFRSAAALYSAMIAKFNLEVMQYRAGLASALGQLDQWKVRVEAEISKTALNDRLAQIYSSTVEAEAVKASLYEAQVRILGAQVDAYKTRMEAFATQADVARVKLSVYKSTVDAYIGSLSGYKAQFAEYEARTKGSIAENRVQEAKTLVSMADMAAAGANSARAGVAMEVESAALRLQARSQGALFDNQKLQNSLETIKAQIAADTAKQSIAEWSANIQLTNVENDAIAAEAQAAARYYEAASNSAYRASEQAMRSMISATQAANIAQEAGSRAAASISQGAYSAVHVNATLTGSGRISGEESQDARQASVISDYLDYSEVYQQILSA